MDERKVVVITGSNGGIGLEAAKALAGEGYHVVANGRRADVLDAAVREVRDQVADASIEGVAADVSVPEQATALIEDAVSRHGRLDALVNNAAWVRAKEFSELTLQEWDAIVGVVLRGTAVCCMAAARQMRRQNGGCVVNVGSESGGFSDPNIAPYNSAKAGVHGLTRSMAVDLGKYGVAVNTVAPGWVWTPMVDRFRRGSHAFLQTVNPLARAGEPDEIAEVIRFLVVSAPLYLTGATIYVDGGESAMAKLYYE